MIRYDVFRALAPEEKYPDTPFAFRLNGVKYDLPLPPPVGDVLGDMLTKSGPFYSLDRYSSPEGVDEVRSDARCIDLPSRAPACADAEFRVDLTEPNNVMGYVSQIAVANRWAAAEIVRRAISTDTFDADVAEWITARFSFFHFCGGFEIARVSYYFDADEKTTVLAMIDGVSTSRNPKSLTERSGRKLRFRDMVATPPH